MVEGASADEGRVTLPGTVFRELEAPVCDVGCEALLAFVVNRETLSLENDEMRFVVPDILQTRINHHPSVKVTRDELLGGCCCTSHCSWGENMGRDNRKGLQRRGDRSWHELITEAEATSEPGGRSVELQTDTGSAVEDEVVLPPSEQLAVNNLESKIEKILGGRLESGEGMELHGK